MNTLDAEDSNLSASAERLLARLQSGEGKDIAQPSVYPGPMAFSEHAEAYFNSAARLCEEPDRPDFCVFGALYGIRHGLELWLKCLAINSMIDTALEEISRGAVDADAVAQRLKLKPDQKKDLFKSLCMLRNCCEDHLVHPHCAERNIDSSSADRAVRFIQGSGHLERYHLANVWVVPVPGHSLLGLWQRVEDWVRELNPVVSANAQQTGCGQPMSAEQLSAVIELIHRWDPGGDTFRYPSSLRGQWNINLRPLNLKELGALARRLQETVVGYENLLEQGYAFSKLRSPQPSTAG